MSISSHTQRSWFNPTLTRVFSAPSCSSRPVCNNGIGGRNMANMKLCQVGQYQPHRTSPRVAQRAPASFSPIVSSTCSPPPDLKQRPNPPPLNPPLDPQTSQASMPSLTHCPWQLPTHRIQLQGCYFPSFATWLQFTLGDGTRDARPLQPSIVSGDFSSIL